MRKLVSQLCKDCRVIPVVVIECVEDAVPLAQCLIDNGLTAIEVTVRTPNALKAIEAIARNVPECTLGVGSILNDAQLKQARDAGGHFGVSPGTSPELLRAITNGDWPFLPGASTVSEALTLRDAGFLEQKLFPAEIVGGIELLKAFSGPVPDVSFCPTGGVKSATAANYLSQRNVFAVGGTWIASVELLECRDWSQIAQNARSVAAI